MLFLIILPPQLSLGFMLKFVHSVQEATSAVGANVACNDLMQTLF